MRTGLRLLLLLALTTMLSLSASVAPIHAFADGQGASAIISISTPNKLAFDSVGDLWVGTFRGEIDEFKPPLGNGSVPILALTGSSTQGSKLGYAVDGTFDSSGNLWAADAPNNRILEFKPPFSSGMNASLVIGQPDFTTTAARPGSVTSVGPITLAFDSSGNLWAADNSPPRILEFKPPFFKGMGASLVIGQRDFTSFSTALSQNTLNCHLCDIAFDPSGDLWVSADYQNRVLEFKPPFRNGMNASVVIGEPDFASSQSSAALNGLSSPVGVAADSAGNLWVGDTVANRRVLQYKAPFVNGMNASLALGQKTLGCCSDLQWGGLAFDSAGNLWASDYANGRVVEFLASVTVVTTSSSTTSSSTISSTSSTTSTKTLGSSTTSVSSPTTSSVTPTSTTSTTSAASGAGGIPEFSYELVGAAVLTAAIVTSYLSIRRRN